MQYKNDNKIQILNNIYDFFTGKIIKFKFIVITQYKLFFKRKKKFYIQNLLFHMKKL